MGNLYFDNLTDYRNGYLKRAPRKSAVIDNAAIRGNVSILGGSNNRALIIATQDGVFLQSYDSLILYYDKKTGDVVKMWDDYSVTTLKHINAFMGLINGQTFNKKSWLEYKGAFREEV